MNNLVKYFYYHLFYFINVYLVLFMALIVFGTILLFILLKFGFKHYILKKLIRQESLDNREYPFNNILDRLLPLLTLFVPLIIVLTGFTDTLWISRLGLLILFHIIIVIPIIFYWSTLRRWDNEIENFAAYKSWAHPRLYKQIALALIYPYIWGFYFSILRYLRLGNTLDLTVITNLFTKDMFCLIFLIPCILSIGFQILILLNRLRTYLWNALYNLAYSFHIKLLVNKVYFKVMEKLFKFKFLCFSLVSVGGPVYYKSATKNYPWWRRLLSYLWFHPNWFTIMMFICLFIELIIKKGQIYFGLYLLCFYPLVRGIIYLLYSFGNSKWVLDCCLSDYISCRWDSVHYPEVFWTYFDDAEFYFGFEFDFTEEQLALISKSKEKSKWNFRKKVSRRAHQNAVFFRVVGKRKFGTVLAASFTSSYRIRWVHTNISNKVFHTATALFTKNNMLQKIALYNNSAKALQYIQKAESLYNTQGSMDPSMFLICPKEYLIKNSKPFIKHLENNTPYHFLELKKDGTRVEAFNRDTDKNLNVNYIQAEPDIVFSEGKNIILADQKTNNPGIGKNKILSAISRERYAFTLDQFLLEFQKTCEVTFEIKKFMDALEQSSGNLSEHQVIWRSGIPLFNKYGWVPPLRVPENFCTRHFSPETLKALEKEYLRLRKVSDMLFARKVPQNKGGTFSQEALDLLNDSEMQRILAE